MDGSEKLRSLVIDKFQKTRCFKNVKSLPVDYDTNKKAWMTVNIGEKTIRRLDRQFVKKKRKVVFIADNCTAHTNIPQLASIELVFLPSNVTSVLQPLDQGVIQNLKVNYRKLLLKDLVAAIDQKKEFHVLDAIFYVHKSWNMMSTTCIANCFRQAGFVSSLNIVDDETEEDDIPLSGLMEYLKNRGHAIEGEAEYGLVDEEIATTSEATISEIVDSEDNDSDPETVVVTQVEAFNAINALRNFFTNHEGAEEHFEKFQNLENIVRKIKPKTRQTCINDYLK
ncbi:tigger transposable element-derived protein 4-like [Parasteatoda tepidariorum]|uniref:tigger transposable element-derived protein 4-like n=1 Tax=Parasteatoda tepidariorum TaxID=114398 RepID=UPI001C72679A|nr:tigger transposable element-derived protein 4-like [Parasteatoda tepidariorum]